MAKAWPRRPATHTQLTSHARKRFNERTTRKRPILLTHFICSPWCVKEEESLLQLGCAGPFQLYWLTRVTVLAALKIWQPWQVKWDSFRCFSNIMTTVLHTFVPHASHNPERILSCQWKNGRNIFLCLLLLSLNFQVSWCSLCVWKKTGIKIEGKSS